MYPAFVMSCWLWALMECAALLSYLVMQAFKPIPDYRFSRVPGSTVVPSSWFASKPGRNQQLLSAAAGL